MALESFLYTLCCKLNPGCSICSPTLDLLSCSIPNIVRWPTINGLGSNGGDETGRGWQLQTLPEFLYTQHWHNWVTRYSNVWHATSMERRTTERHRRTQQAAVIRWRSKYFCLISALFRDITQRVVVIRYRRFGTNYRSHLKGRDPWNGTDKFIANVANKLPLHAV